MKSVLGRTVALDRSGIAGNQIGNLDMVRKGHLLASQCHREEFDFHVMPLNDAFVRAFQRFEGGRIDASR